MFPRFSVKVPEEPLFFQLPHNILIHEISRFLVFQPLFHRELLDSQRNVLGFGETDVPGSPNLRKFGT